MTEPEPLQFIGENEVRWRGRVLTYFSGCDYFRLARNSKVTQAARTAISKNPLNVAASRLTTGNQEIYTQLETRLADFFGAESALVLPNGYLGPLAVAQALADEFSHALVDEFAHAALLDAARMLDCPVWQFNHRDVSYLARALSKCGSNARPIILTDGMFSHDGSAAPLSEYLKILPRTGMILVDDAHGAGVLGKTGRGTLEYAGVTRKRILQCATLSKAFGVYGGVVLGPRQLREKILARSRLFTGSTPLPPPLANAALAGLDILQREPSRRARLFRNASQLRTQLCRSGWEISETPGPIIRLPSMNPKAANDLKQRLLKAGIYPPFIKYGNASVTGVFRFVISSEHTRTQLNRLASVLADFKSTKTAKRFSADRESARTKGKARPRPQQSPGRQTRR